MDMTPFAHESQRPSRRRECSLGWDGLVVDLPATGSPVGGTRPDPLTGQPIDWSQWLTLGIEAEAQERLRRATMTGRPCGSEAFALDLETRLGRRLTPRKRGRKPAASGEPGFQ